jgi:protein-tyrosine kinase
MSRIEKALEKAAELRKKFEGVDYGEKTVAVPPSTSVQVKPVFPTVSPEVALKIDNPFLVTLKEPSSHVAEEYRKLKSVVMKLTKKEQYLNTLMVTSTVGGEGKSVTSLNLAITMAQEYDHTILLVDADVRKSSLHQYLSLDAKVGLTDCLLNDVDISEALIRTGIGKLSFLPAGRQVRDPAELLSSNRMKSFLDEIKNRYPDRYVIVDTPPVLSSAESISLGNMVDGVIFVVMEGVAPLDKIQEALGLLKDSQMLGLVYNNMTSGSFGGYYGHYSHNYSGYGMGKEGYVSAKTESSRNPGQQEQRRSASEAAQKQI